MQDDAFGETVSAGAPAVPVPLSGQAVSQSGGGRHLVSAGPQTVSGRVLYTVTLTGSGQGSAAARVPEWGINGYCKAGSTFTGYVNPDTRAVIISADCDGPGDSHPTSYKILSGGVDANGDGNWAKVTHVRDPDGTMEGDIGIPYGEEHTETSTDYLGTETKTHIVNPTSLTISYKAHLTGRWSTQDSHYWWNSSLKDYSMDENLAYLINPWVPTEDDIQALKNVYVGPMIDNDNEGAIIANEAGFNGTADHLWFKYQNGNNLDAWPNGLMNTGTEGDKAIATANYYMNVHQANEIFPSNKHSLLQTGYNLPENSFLRGMDLEVEEPGYAIYGGNSIDCKWDAARGPSGENSRVQSALLNIRRWREYHGSRQC